MSEKSEMNSTKCDKTGWVKKKLGEVLQVERGGSPRPISAFLTDGEDGINWIKIGDAVEGGKYIYQTKEKIKPEGVKKSRLVHKGDFILSNSMSFGKPYILQIDGCIHDGWLVLHDENNTLDKIWLYYYLGSPFVYREFQRLAEGGVVNNLNSAVVRNLKIEIPPLSEQHRIVSELDCLNGIIEKQKEQLKQLDELAQSIFYDMFGDPVENEKGWKLKEIGLLCSPKKKIERANKLFSEDDMIMYIDISSINNKNNTISVPVLVSFSEAPSRAQQKVCINDILVSLVRPNLKNIALLKISGDNIVASSGFCILRALDTINILYLLYCVTCNSFTQYLVDKTTGANYPAVKEDDIKGKSIAVPPLPLQQAFASKIEAIEHQKELIKQSLAETENLFNSRMDYYFG